jgi:hypothetical protein
MSEAGENAKLQVTDPIPDTGDFRREMESLLESGGRQTLKYWEKILKGEGKQTVRRRCQHCTQQNEFEIDVANTEEQRRILVFLADNTLLKPKQEGGPGGTSNRDAQALLADLRDATDDELAVLRVELLEKLGEPVRPDVHAGALVAAQRLLGA